MPIGATQAITSKKIIELYFLPKELEKKCVAKNTPINRPVKRHASFPDFKNIYWIFIIKMQNYKK